MESVAYIVAYLLAGCHGVHEQNRLPWMMLPSERQPRQDAAVTTIAQVRRTIAALQEESVPEALCSQLSEPGATAVSRYLALCQRLKFADKPDYDGLRDCFALQGPPSAAMGMQPIGSVPASPAKRAKRGK